MSYFPALQGCIDCKESWTIHKGMIGSTWHDTSLQICPFCSSTNVEGLPYTGSTPLPQYVTNSGTIAGVSDTVALYQSPTNPEHFSDTPFHATGQELVARCLEAEKARDAAIADAKLAEDRGRVKGLKLAMEACFREAEREKAQPDFNLIAWNAADDCRLAIHLLILEEQPA